MARITIEDCTEKVANRFHLVQMAAIRAKQLKKGATPLVQSEENKEVVVALREIAAGLVAADFGDPDADRTSAVTEEPLSVDASAVAKAAGDPSAESAQASE